MGCFECEWRFRSLRLNVSERNHVLIDRLDSNRRTQQAVSQVQLYSYNFANHVLALVSVLGFTAQNSLLMSEISSLSNTRFI